MNDEELNGLRQAKSCQEDMYGEMAASNTGMYLPSVLEVDVASRGVDTALFRAASVRQKEIRTCPTRC